MILDYDNNKWELVVPRPKNTLQLFITNKCNLRCKGCFVEHKLGEEEMSIEEYRRNILKYWPHVEKVILLGGEPTLHPNIRDMLIFNDASALSTTIYTNGFNLKVLEDMHCIAGVKDEVLTADPIDVDIRIGVHGLRGGDKPLADVPKTTLPVTIVYMLTKQNAKKLSEAAALAEMRFNCKAFYISSIRDIAQTHDFWKDTEETISPQEYAEVVQKFIHGYGGRIPEIHISRRGVLEPDVEYPEVKNCRFGNIFPDGEKIVCPLDISIRKTVPELEFDSPPCNKNGCILQKIVLRRK